MNARELCVFYGLKRRTHYVADAMSTRKPTLEPPTLREVRDVLSELADIDERARVVEDADGLDALKPDTVIRDADGYVCERWPAGWMTVALTDVHKPVLPVRVLAWPQEATS